MELFVFPLGQMLLYPSVSKPLNIFEPKYIQMVHDSLESQTPIAIGFVDEGEFEHRYQSGRPLDFVRPIVGFGVPSIVEKRPDGSLLIFLQGVGKARLGNVISSDRPYIACEAELIAENLEINAEQTEGVLILQKVLTKWMQEHIADPGSRAQFLAQINSPAEVVGCFASYIIADSDMKQLILETDDINDKIALIRGLISSDELI